jgi:hypothetical protein
MILAPLIFGLIATLFACCFNERKNKKHRLYKRGYRRGYNDTIIKNGYDALLKSGYFDKP